MKRGKKKAWFYSMPFLIIVGLMIVVPLLYTVEISFTNMSIYHWKDYHCVGLDNYKKALLAFDSGFLPAFLRTLFMDCIQHGITVDLWLFRCRWAECEGIKTEKGLQDSADRALGDAGICINSVMAHGNF